FVGQEAYQSTCPDLPEPAVAGYIRNRDLVETFLQAADLLEQDGWDLLQRADLLPILYHPDVVYRGPDLGNVSNLSDVEKQVLAEMLAQEREPIPFLWMHPELFTVPLAVPASAQIS